MDPNPRPAFVYQVSVRTTPERLWQAITDADFTRRYYFGTTVEGDWRPGGAFRYVQPDGSTMIDGEVIEADPPRRLVTTFRPHFAGDPATVNVSRVAWEIEPHGDLCTLTVVHEGIRDEGDGFADGWARIVAALKTLLETDASTPVGA